MRAGGLAPKPPDFVHREILPLSPVNAEGAGTWPLFMVYFFHKIGPQPSVPRWYFQRASLDHPHCTGCGKPALRVHRSA